jgi:pyrroline-5-carboxylate reductase
MVVGFVGSGSMAAAMARGWAGEVGGMLFSDSGSGRAAALAAEVGGEAVSSNTELAGRSDLLVLAVKPAMLDEVAAELAGAKAVVSLLGATPLERVTAALPGARTCRVMPNVEELARELVVETTGGTAELLRLRHPRDVRRAVASPGGSTEAGLEALDREGVAGAFEAAVRASLERMRGS